MKVSNSWRTGWQAALAAAALSVSLSGGVLWADEPATDQPANGDAFTPDQIDPNANGTPAADKPAEEGPNQGADDLAAAIDAKINAANMDDLGRAILLCETALLKGLDEQSKEFAQTLLASTRFERATRVSSLILEQDRPNPQWPQLRTIALADLEKAVEVAPKLADAHLLIARLQALPGGDEERARKAASAAVDSADPEDPEFKSRALMLRADLSEDDEQRLADYDAALKLFPNNSEALRSRGLYQLQNDKPDEAEADLLKALELDAEDHRTLEALGVVLFMQDKFEEAEQRLTEAIELQPESALAHTYRARVRTLQKNYDDALADIDKALGLAPRTPSLMMLRIQIYERSGDTDKALAEAEKLLKQQPDLSEAMQLKAVLLASAGRTQEAVEFMEQQSKAKPDDLELKVQLAMLYNAELQFDKALAVYTEILEAQPELASAYRGRGDTHLNKGDHAAAIADYEQALKFDPENSGVLNNFAWVLSTSPDDNIRDAEKAIDLATKAGDATKFKQAHILSTIAAAHAEQGNWDEAVKWSAKAVEIGDDEVREQLVEELDAFKAKKPWREMNYPDGRRVSGPLGEEKTTTKDGKEVSVPDDDAEE